MCIRDRKKAAAPAEESNVDFTHEAEISYDDFCKVELRVEMCIRDRWKGLSA